MGSFGERMRREREKRGITLDSISETTKIGTHILEAIEKEEFGKLPGGIFNKGFVRSYASFLGMDGEHVLKEFIEVAGDPEQPLPDPPFPRRREIPQAKERLSWAGIATAVVCTIAMLFGGWKAARMARRAAGATWLRAHSTSSQPMLAPAQSMAANNGSSSSSQEDEQPSAVPAMDQPENVPTATLQPASTTIPTPEPVPAVAPTQSQKFVILVKAHKPAWVSITADGKPVLEGVLRRKKRIHAHSRVVLKTNNAGALAVSRNGKPLPPLGEQNQQTTVTFTPDGVTR